MMMNCPKCGFLQPQDQYCARCGVNVETYKPQATDNKQNNKKIVFVVAGLLLLISAGGWFYLNQTKKNEITERVHFLKGLPSSPIAQDSQTIASESQNPIQEGTMESVTNSTDTTNPNSNSQNTSASTNLVSDDGQNSQGISVKIFYAEVSNFYLNKLIEESQGNSQYVNFGDYGVGILSSLDTKITGAQAQSNIKIFESKEAQLLGDKNQTQFFTGNKGEDDQDLGLSTVFNVSDFEDGQIRGEIEVIRSMRESNDKQVPPIKRSFPSAFELTKENGIFITGLLPHKPTSEVEEELLATNVFQIYQSARFQNRNSEFVIFFQVLKK